MRATNGILLAVWGKNPSVLCEDWAADAFEPGSAGIATVSFWTMSEDGATSPRWLAPVGAVDAVLELTPLSWPVDEIRARSRVFVCAALMDIGWRWTMGAFVLYVASTAGWLGWLRVVQRRLLSRRVPLERRCSRIGRRASNATNTVFSSPRHIDAGLVDAK
jgi:hypothetical protein